jgi:spore germination protein
MLERIIHVTIQAALVLAVAATAYWGYQEHQDKNSILIKAENNYQRAFHDLNNNIANLEDELGKSIAMNSRKLIAPCMTNIWRIAYVAQNNVGQLPLNLMAFSKTEEFLADIADYTYDIGMRDLDTDPLSEEEWNRLKTLHAQAKEIRGELRKVQTQVLNENLRWMDVEVALASDQMDMDRTIVQGFEGLERQVQGYIETEAGSTENKSSDSFEDRAKIKGKKVSEQEAKNRVQAFFNFDRNVKMDVTESEADQGLSAYSFHIQQKGNTLAVDVSQNGGHVLWFLNSKDIEQSRISLHEAQNKALQFLAQHGFEDMTSVEANQYDNVGVFEMVREVNGVRIYPELVAVKVALDDGQVIGFQATDYYVNHDPERRLPQPKISADEAKQNVNTNLKVHEDHLSLVEIKEGEYALCYELLGTIENETFRIFVNAETGEEEKIEKMKQAEPMV